jgi:hypothetical protein
LTVYDCRAVFLGECAALRIGKNVQYGLGRAAQLHAARRDHNRAVDEDRVRHHGVDQLVIRQGWIIQLQFVIRCTLPKVFKETASDGPAAPNCAVVIDQLAKDDVL